jgi:LuxR family maltose regulon positive regulatory protein
MALGYEALLDWFPQTKFVAPFHSRETVTRTRLVDSIGRAARTHRLVLISAPAGSGKTTILSSLPLNNWDFPIAWLSLDEEDNDPACFMAGLTGAIARLITFSGFQTQNLQAEQTSIEYEGRRFAGILINEIIKKLDGHFGVVLDDLHWVSNPAVYGLLDYLLERMPPQMHLLVGTRYDPPLALSRLRARGQLAEFRLPELRFTAEELSGLFNQKLGLDLNENDLRLLLQQTDGWAAALRMLANTLSVSDPTSEKDRSAFLNRLTQVETHIFDYLAEEVFNRQNIVDRTFLLETSILSELNSELCEAVSGREDSGELLEKLYRNNMFMIAVDKKSRTYRYHDLFREFLQHKLANEMPEAVTMLHKCAAHAFSEKLPGYAVRHFLAGELWEEAAQAILQLGNQMLRQGLIMTLNSWIETLPETTLREHPRLLYFQGLYNTRANNLVMARTQLEHALEAFVAAGLEQEQAETLTLLVLCAYGQGDFKNSQQYTLQALELPIPVKIRVQLLMSQGFQVGIGCTWEDFREAVKQALELTLQSDDREVFYMAAFQMHVISAHVEGILPIYEGFYAAVLERYAGKDTYLEAAALLQLSYTNLLRGNLEKSQETIQRAKKAAESLELPGLSYLDLLMCEIMQKQWQGKYQEVADYVRHSFNRLENEPIVKPWLSGFYSNWIFASYHEGNPGEVQRIFSQVNQIPEYSERPEPRAMRLVEEAIIKITDRHFEPAEQLLKQAIMLQQEWPFSFIWNDAKIWLAYVYLNRESYSQTLQILEPLLEKCEQENTPGLILREGPKLVVPLLKLAIDKGVKTRFARHLLHLIGVDFYTAPQNFKVPGNGKTLSAREIEVIQLLANRATNREIAEKLVISDETVKSHVKHILQKLDLTSRMEVARRARELGLL